MERTDEYRKALDVPISELSIDRIIEEIRRQPENFEALYHLTTDEKLLVSWRALWVCDKLCRQYPDWFAPLREELTGRLVTCKHDGSKRLLLSILYHAPAEEIPSVELLNFCLDCMLSRHESIGVQSLAVRMAYHLCKRQVQARTRTAQRTADHTGKHRYGTVFDRCKNNCAEHIEENKSEE